MRRSVRGLAGRVLVFLLASSGWAHAATEWRTLELHRGSTLQYAELLPPGYRPEAHYPVLLALPPGNQTRSMVERALKLYWSKLAAHGWIVVSPATPDGRLFFQGPERMIPELLDRLVSVYRIEGNKVHLAGVSNGGRSAFRIATLHPERFASLTVLPGFPPEPEDFARLERIRALPVALFGGSLDRRWVAQMKRTRAKLEELGASVTLTVYPGEGHVPESLAGGEVLLRTLETRRRGRTKRKIHD